MLHTKFERAICWMNASSGLPCPGCGLMRSVSCTARGMWYDAWTYHPFGPLLFAACVLVAGWSLLPMRHRERIASWLERRRSLPTRLYTALVAAFLTFGMIRALLTFSE